MITPATPNDLIVLFFSIVGVCYLLYMLVSFLLGVVSDL